MTSRARPKVLWKKHHSHPQKNAPQFQRRSSISVGPHAPRRMSCRCHAVRARDKGAARARAAPGGQSRAARPPQAIGRTPPP